MVQKIVSKIKLFWKNMLILSKKNNRHLQIPDFCGFDICKFRLLKNRLLQTQDCIFANWYFKTLIFPSYFLNYFRFLTKWLKKIMEAYFNAETKLSLFFILCPNSCHYLLVKNLVRKCHWIPSKRSYYSKTID